MDAPEADLDIKLQKISSDLLTELDQSLTNLLRKPDDHGKSRVRLRVRAREIHKITSQYLDPFQELPQLLDPYLPKWIPFLSAAFLEHLQTRKREKQKDEHSAFLLPVDYAICKFLYTFCKIRGEKVIVHFLNVETRYLELLLTAIEEAEKVPVEADFNDKWSWEQRYIVLLWISHLMLAPFDLSTISSIDIEETSVPEIQGLVIPSHLPGLTLRLLPLAVKYLASPGKERDGAKTLLVRTAMRRDMQELGVLDSLIQWAMSSLRPRKDAPPETTHFYLGVLSLLAGLLRSSSETTYMDRYLVSIFHTVHSISIDDNPVAMTINSLASARKLILKVMRSVIVSLLRQDQNRMATIELTETTIGHLLDSVSDNDTPVRFAASKSLSIITLKLDPDMASQVVEATLEALNRNVLWNNTPTSKPVRDLSSVDPLEWHGLMLTLSHLLYRRSPPTSQLSDIVHALLLGLSFEQRNTSGGSVGANVRDAACFGIWALARRYTSEELLAVPTQSIFAAKAHPESASILQVLGTELVTTASLDSSGNIRRGSSAALQELIGRHPDTVEKGIWVVQTVDYHAVARRSRAMEEVALGAARLSSQYGEALLDAILGWRGVGDVEASSRRNAAMGFGNLVSELCATSTGTAYQRLEDSIQLIAERLEALSIRQVEERHGLLLCFAAVLEVFPGLLQKLGSEVTTEETMSQVLKVLPRVGTILADCKNKKYRKVELVAEAASKIVISLMPMLAIAVLEESILADLAFFKHLTSNEGQKELIAALDENQDRNDSVNNLLASLGEVVPLWLSINDPDTSDPAASAALILLIFSAPSKRASMLKSWANKVQSKPTSRTTAQADGYFHCLAMAQPLMSSLTGGDDTICDAILQRWQADKEIETRVGILQGLTQSIVLQNKPTTFLPLIAEGLNDYTTNARGDVGSLVRVHALRAVCVLLKAMREAPGTPEWAEAAVDALLYSTLRLAAEKLDRVRHEAQAAVALIFNDSHIRRFKYLTFSSRNYFFTLLRLPQVDHLHPTVTTKVQADKQGWMIEFLAGFVTSADTGNEDLVISSRAALTDFCEASSSNLELVCVSLLHNLKIRHGVDRIVVPTLEIISFLFHVGLFQVSQSVDMRSLCLQVQKAAYKTGNVRKLEACVRLYGCIASLGEVGGGGVLEARKRLGALMYHPWPKVRTFVVDELWVLLGEVQGLEQAGTLLGVDWGTANKGQIKTFVEELDLV